MKSCWWHKWVSIGYYRIHYEVEGEGLKEIQVPYLDAISAAGIGPLGE